MWHINQQPTVGYVLTKYHIIELKACAQVKNELRQEFYTFSVFREKFSSYLEITSAQHTLSRFSLAIQSMNGKGFVTIMCV